MIRSYLTLAWRFLRKRLGTTVINVVGLAAGLAACLLIGLWVQHQFSYDDFHPSAERIYRIGLDVQISSDRVRRSAQGPWPMAPAIAEEIPEVQAATRFGYLSSEIARVDDRSLAEMRTVLADSLFLDVFDGFRLERGDRVTALRNTDGALLTASTAERLFGRTDVVGETMHMRGAVRTITGILEDVPETSHIDFDVILAYPEPPAVFQGNWTGFAFHTYVKLLPKASPETFRAKMPTITEGYVAPQLQDRFNMSSGEFVWEFVPLPLTDVYLYSTRENDVASAGSITTVYVISAVGLFILLIACVNFMNLATARASERATEVGMRKALGAGRDQLMGQFLGEAVLTTVFAAGVALVAASAALPAFNDLAGTSIQFADALQPSILAFTAGLVLLVGALSGSYPAVVLSRFAPARVLKSGARTGTGGEGKTLRQALVIFQFAISIALIVATLGAREQFDYIQNKRLGIDHEQVVQIEDTDDLQGRMNGFVQRVRQTPGVVDAGAGDGIFGRVSSNAFVPDPKEVEPGDIDAAYGVRFLQVGTGFLETLGTEMVRGRPFDPARRTDSTAAVVNQAAADLFGWEDPLGREIYAGDSTRVYTVIGVVDDFHYQSLRSQVEPLLLFMDNPVSPSLPGDLYVRLAPGETQDALQRIRTAWEETTQDPFQYSYLDNSYAALHADVQKTGRMFSIFSGLAVLIACLGLFGLFTHTVQRRAKEIGVRKSLGATATSIVRLLSTDVLKLMAVASAVALPAAFLGMQQWLSDFAYRATIGVDVLGGATILAALVALVTVSYHAYRASQLNPAQTLKDE